MSSAAVSAGDRSSATSTNGGFADRQAWGGSAHEVGDHTLADVMQVGCALGW